MLRRLCALLTALALFLSVPMTAAGRCLECPPGCPMHRAAHKSGLSCHRGGQHQAPRPSDGVCVRASCGHTPVYESGHLSAVLARPVDAGQIVLSRPVRRARLVLRSRVAAEPPHGPPKLALS